MINISIEIVTKFTSSFDIFVKNNETISALSESTAILNKFV